MRLASPSPCTPAVDPGPCTQAAAIPGPGGAPPQTPASPSPSAPRPWIRPAPWRGSVPAFRRGRALDLGAEIASFRLGRGALAGLAPRAPAGAMPLPPQGLAPNHYPGFVPDPVRASPQTPNAGFAPNPARAPSQTPTRAPSQPPTRASPRTRRGLRLKPPTRAPPSPHPKPQRGPRPAPGAAPTPNPSAGPALQAPQRCPHPSLTPPRSTCRRGGGGMLGLLEGRTGWWRPGLRWWRRGGGRWGRGLGRCRRRCRSICSGCR